jgi:lipopolysaccharide biosynthesis glycosyltransferase
MSRDPTLSPIHVALASDDRGTIGLAVAVHSLLRHTPRPVYVWIIEDSISPGTQRRLEACWSTASNLAGVRFFPIRNLPIKLPHWWGTNQWPIASAARFQLAELLPAAARRCIYIDIDVLVGTDVGVLFDQDMRGLPLGMTDGFMNSESDRQYILGIGLDPGYYGNAGVLLMDLEAWRRENAGARLIEHAKSMKPAGLWFFDQDILNSYFKGRFLLLDGRWNTRDAARSPEGLIQHFAGKPKPWQMAPHEMEHIGLTAWARARADTGFEPAPPSVGSAISRRLGNGVSWVQRQVRKRLGGRSSSSAE